MKKYLILLPASILVGALLAASVFLLMRPQIDSWIGASSNSNSQVITAVTRTQEVALVTLSVEGIQERRTEAGQVLFLSIPNSRASFLRYSFDAKLGFDAKDAVVAENTDGSLKITLPRFIVIGTDNQNIEVAAENNDVLSWTTPEIDKVAMVNDVFGDELHTEYLSANSELLRDQARDFYTSIVTAIDPSVELEFEFAD